MELGPDHFRSLNQDLLVEIMSRLDGSTLAATASTCTALRDAAGDERLWQKLCNETWPSTSNGQLQFQIASSKIGSFKSLYTDAFPLVLYEVTRRAPKRIPTGTIQDTTSSPWDFISLIDIYYKGRCIFSKVVDGMIESMYRTCNNDFSRFLCYPFKLDLLDFYYPMAAFTGYEGREDLCNMIVGDLQLSWILNGEQSMAVMKQALICPRSINHYMVELGYQQFCKQKIEMKLRQQQEESLANIACAATAIAALLGICYACATLL